MRKKWDCCFPNFLKMRILLSKWGIIHQFLQKCSYFEKNWKKFPSFSPNFAMIFVSV